MLARPQRHTISPCLRHVTGYKPHALVAYRKLFGSAVMPEADMHSAMEAVHGVDIRSAGQRAFVASSKRQASLERLLARRSASQGSPMH